MQRFNFGRKLHHDTLIAETLWPLTGILLESVKLQFACGAIEARPTDEEGGSPPIQEQRFASSCQAPGINVVFRPKSPSDSQPHGDLRVEVIARHWNKQAERGERGHRIQNVPLQAGRILRVEILSVQNLNSCLAWGRKGAQSGRQRLPDSAVVSPRLQLHLSPLLPFRDVGIR
jgi:hypothetical protein